MPASQLSYSALEASSVIRIAGHDATGFLHAQLTQDIEALGPGHGSFAGWLDARGRVRALFETLRTDEGFLLIAPDEIVASVATEIGRFVLRARVTITPDPSLACVALLGESGAWARDHGIDLGAQRHAVCAHGNVVWHRLSETLVHGIGETEALDEACTGIDHGEPADAELAEIRLGIPSITTRTRDRFIPQMLNLDRLGAVAFDKGCYPGQEVVARAHHLGTVKRRMIRLHADAPADPGDAIIGPDGAQAGEVVRAAADRTGTEMLAVVQIARADDALWLRDRTAPAERLPLPYE